MVFNWSLSDIKSSQLFWILLSILLHLRCVVVLIVLVLPLISNYYCLFSERIYYNWHSVTFTFYRFFCSQARSKYLSIFSLSFIFILGSAGMAKSNRRQVLFFRFSNRDLVIHLYVKIPENFLRLIFLDRFWFVHIPFRSMVKIQSLAQFPVDHLSNPVMFCLVIHLCQLAAFVIWLIVSSLSKHNLHLLFCSFTYFCFKTIGRYWVLLCSY